MPRLRQSTPPVIDSNFDVVLTNVPASPGLALVLSGVSRTLYGALPLPLDLGGAPGCQLLTSVELSQIAIASGGTATSTFAVPNNSALLTFELHQQAFVLDGGVNALGGTLSNALRARLGL